MGKTLMIGSCESFSGKSALVLGIARYLRAINIAVRYGKPLATSLEMDGIANVNSDLLIDDDVRFVGSIIGLNEEALIPSVDILASDTAEKRLYDSFLQPGGNFQKLKDKLADSFSGLNILEAAGSINEGMIYGLSLSQLANEFKVKVLLVHLWKDSRSVDPLLSLIHI